MKTRLILFIGLLIPLITLLTGCSGYTYKDAVKNGDVIGGPGGPLHVEKLDQFVDHAASRQQAKLTVVNFTVEGQPDIGKLEYKDGKIQYSWSTRSKLNKKRNDLRYKTACSTIETIEEQLEGNVVVSKLYILKGCEETIGMRYKEPDSIIVYQLPIEQE